MLDALPSRSLQEAQWSASTLFFLPTVFLFFFLIGLGRTHNPKGRLAWFLSWVIILAYGYATLLTLAPLLGSFKFLSLVQTIAIIAAPLAGVLGYRAGCVSVVWMDSGYAWKILLLILLLLSGSWAIRFLEYSPGPSLLPGGEPWPGVGLYTRAGKFVINRESSLDQELYRPAFGTALDATALLVLALVLSAICLACRVKHRARGLQLALVAYPFLLQRFVPEGTVCLAACLALGYTMDRGLVREAGRASSATRLLATATLTVLSIAVANVVVWKFVALAPTAQWDIVCLAYGSAGLIFGRCIALWNVTAPKVRRPHFSIDEALIRLAKVRATHGRLPIRLDLGVLLLPFTLFGLIALSASWLRGVRISSLVLTCILAAAAGWALLLTGIQLRAWLATLRCVPVARDRMALMRYFSAQAHKASLPSGQDLLAFFVLPIVVPSAVCLYTGFDTAAGVAATLATLIATAGLSWLSLAAAQSRPPAVLVLGSSTAQSIRLHEQASRAVFPLRAVSLLAFDHQGETDKLPPRSDCLRTIWNDDWFAIVKGLVELAPIVVIDGREASPGTQHELEHLFQSGHLKRTVLVSHDDRSIPLLDWWRRNRSAPLDGGQFLQVAEESGVSKLLARELSRLPAPAGPHLPISAAPFGDIAAGPNWAGWRSAGLSESLAEFRDWLGRFAAQLVGCLVLLLIVAPLAVGFLFLTGVIDAPKSWGPAPWSTAASRSRQLLRSIDPAVTGDALRRVEAVREIFQLQERESIVAVQAKALEDPDERVQVEGLTRLSQCLRENPRLLIDKNALGMRLNHRVRLDLIRILEANKSAVVRQAAADFWADAAEFQKEGLERLRKMRQVEGDAAVRSHIDAAIAKVEGRR